SIPSVISQSTTKISFYSPQARFLLHAISMSFRQPTGLEEKLKSLWRDLENIAEVMTYFDIYMPL
ncbi:hypothetical protein MYX76_16365, partial [Desulfobacterota bacterium AH_259_B03_O07]|nr:hypothetical protein [Desulfobacterota bacterium AH_259_B03_O07]